MIRITYVEHQYHKKHIGYTSVRRKEACLLKVTNLQCHETFHQYTIQQLHVKSQPLVTAPRTKNDWIISNTKFDFQQIQLITLFYLPLVTTQH
jgi:hypothetical protein